MLNDRDDIESLESQKSISVGKNRKSLEDRLIRLTR